MHKPIEVVRETVDWISLNIFILLVFRFRPVLSADMAEFTSSILLKQFEHLFIARSRAK